MITSIPIQPQGIVIPSTDRIVRSGNFGGRTVAINSQQAAYAQPRLQIPEFITKAKEIKQRLDNPQKQEQLRLLGQMPKAEHTPQEIKFNNERISYLSRRAISGPVILHPGLDALLIVDNQSVSRTSLPFIDYFDLAVTEKQLKKANKTERLLAEPSENTLSTTDETSVASLSSENLSEKFDLESLDSTIATEDLEGPLGTGALISRSIRQFSNSLLVTFFSSPPAPDPLDWFKDKTMTEQSSPTVPVASIEQFDLTRADQGVPTTDSERSLNQLSLKEWVEETLRMFHKTSHHSLVYLGLREPRVDPLNWL